MFEKMMPGKKYPFLVSNTDRSDQGRMHWWSIMNISPKKELFFFDLYGIEGMKHFTVSDDKKIVGKILKGIETIDQKDKKLTLCKLKFSMNAYEKLAENKIKKLSEIAQDLFHLIHNLGKNKQLTNFVKVWVFENPIQMLKTVTCGPFQIYFYENLFFPDKNSKVDSYKKLTNSAIETLINEPFTLDQEKKRTNNP